MPAPDEALGGALEPPGLCANAAGIATLNRATAENAVKQRDVDILRTAHPLCRLSIAYSQSAERNSSNRQNEAPRCDQSDGPHQVQVEPHFAEERQPETLIHDNGNYGAGREIPDRVEERGENPRQRILGITPVQMMRFRT